MPFEHLFDREEISAFFRNTSSVTGLSQFQLKTKSDIDHFLDSQKSRASIKNVFLLYDQDDSIAIKQMTKYFYYTLGSIFVKSAYITDSKLLPYLADLVLKEYGKPLYGTDDKTLISLACDGPHVVSLDAYEKLASTLTMFQTMKLAAGIPSLELDSTAAQMAGVDHDGSIDLGLRIFTIVTKIIDYNQDMIKKINRIEREIYCEFRGKVRITWVDGYFNPARMNLLGLEPHMSYPLAAFVDFSAANPKPYPERKAIESSDIRSFLRDSLSLTDEQFKNKYYNDLDDLRAKRSIVASYKSLLCINSQKHADLWKVAKNRVAVLISAKLKAVQINRIVKHFAHAKKRLDMLFGKESTNIVFGIAIQDKVEKQKLMIYKDGSLLATEEIRRSTYSAKSVMEFVAQYMAFKIDEYSHVPEDVVASYINRDPQYALTDEYLYTDL